MATTENITLYTAKICPFAQRVEIAIAEAGAKNITQYQIDLQNKPEWYPKVNPVTKVPALAYGGPAVAPDQPSPDSVKIAESLVLLEFFADLYPSLLSKDPVKRAQARFAMDTVGTKVFPAFIGFSMRGDKTVEELSAGFEAFQSLLPAEGYAVGDWSIADAAIAPFLGRAEALLRNGVGKFKEEDGKAAYAELFQGAKFARLQKYWQDVSSRDSWKKTFDEDYIVNSARARYANSK